MGLSWRLGSRWTSGGPIPALAWSFQDAAQRVVIAGSSWDPDAIIAFAKDAALLVHEAVFIPTAEDAVNAEVELDIAQLDLERPMHVSINEIGRVAQRARVEELALIRLRPPPLYTFRFQSIVGRSFDGEVVIPADGETIWP